MTCPSEPVVVTRSFGDVKVGVYDSGRIIPYYPLAPGWKTPDQDVNAEGHALLGVNGMTVQIGHAVLVIDPLELRGADDIAPLASSIPGPALDASLGALGIDAQAVTHVLISHAHTDHVSGLVDDHGQLRFPNAEHFVPRDDWHDFVVAAADWPPGHVYARVPGILEPVQHAGLLRLVDDDLTVLAGVDLIPAPGETGGHQVVRIETPERPVFYLGDLVHYPVELIDPSLAIPGRDPELLRAGRIRVLSDTAESEAAVVYTHSRFPGWGTVEQVTSDSFRWHYTRSVTTNDR